MAISERRLLANRLNALKSTGPRTPDGKARVSKNRMRHGLSGVDPVLPEECVESFHLFEGEVNEHLDPRQPIEVMLAGQICSLLWRMRRIGRMEVRVFEQALEHESARKCDTSLDAVARQLSQPDHALMTMSRYERSLRNALMRTLSEYRRVKDTFGAPRSCRDYHIAPVPRATVSSAPMAFASDPPRGALPDRSMDDCAPSTLLSAAQDDEVIDALPIDDAPVNDAPAAPCPQRQSAVAHELTIQTQRQSRQAAPQPPAAAQVTAAAEPEKHASNAEKQTQFGLVQSHFATDQSQPGVAERREEALARDHPRPQTVPRVHTQERTQAGIQERFEVTS